MLFYTQQNRSFLQNKEITTVTAKYENPDFKKPYSWLKHQYQIRVNPHFNIENAFIWGWPDKETALWYAKDMSRDQYLLEIEVDDNTILTSDFFGWHAVLNNWEPETWPFIFNEQDMRNHNLLEPDETFTPQLITDHIYRKNIKNIFCK